MTGWHAAGGDGSTFEAEEGYAAQEEGWELVKTTVGQRKAGKGQAQGPKSGDDDGGGGGEGGGKVRRFAPGYARSRGGAERRGTRRGKGGSGEGGGEG